uniref:Uncharacterized protein n=1 Tax=Tanacetum cinerariifolium TaxID=118510 RepID=A0A6L2NSQ3_TANCI|nr:hypothetical protein [Tanacetum cinerariifolium]
MVQNIDFSGSDQIQTPQYPEIHPSSQEISNEVFQADHSDQNKESLENSSDEIAASNPNQEKEEPPQDSDIHQLIEEFAHKEPEYPLSMGYEHLSITPETESDEVTESNAENLLPIPSECKVILKDKRDCDVPVSTIDVCDNHSDIFSDSKIDDDVSVYDNDFEDIEYVEASLSDPEIVSIEVENVVQQEEEEVDLEDISQIQDVVLREKLLKTRSGNTTHADNSLSEYDSFCFEIEPDLERLINLVKNNIYNDSLNDPLLEEADLFLAFDNSIPPGIENVADDSEGDIHFLEELLINDSILSHESSNSNFEDNPSVSRPPPEPPDAETDAKEEIPFVMNDKDKFDEDYYFFMFAKNIPCSPKCKIVGQLLLDHPLRHEIVYTVDIFRSTLKLPVETAKNPFIATATMKFIQPFMQIVGYQGVVDKRDVDSGYDIRATKEYKEYIKLFVGVDVPMIQLQPVIFTQGMHKTKPSAHSHHQAKETKYYSILPPDDDQERDDMAEATLLSLTLHKTSLAAEARESIAKVQEKLEEEEIEKMVKGEDDEESYASEFVDSMFQVNDDNFGNMIEAESHKEHSKNIDDDDETKKDKKDDKKDDEKANDDEKKDETGSMETRKEKMHIPIPSPTRSLRKTLSSYKTLS